MFFFPLETELPRFNVRLPWPLTPKTDSVWECILTFLLNSEETPSVHSSDILFQTFQIHLWPPQYNFFEAVEEKIGVKKIIPLLHHYLLLVRFIIKSYFFTMDASNWASLEMGVLCFNLWSLTPKVQLVNPWAWVESECRLNKILKVGPDGQMAWKHKAAACQKRPKKRL